MTIATATTAATAMKRISFIFLTAIVPAYSAVALIRFGLSGTSIPESFAFRHTQSASIRSLPLRSLWRMGYIEDGGRRMDETVCP